jgi:hypothetical protein
MCATRLDNGIRIMEWEASHTRSPVSAGGDAPTTEAPCEISLLDAGSDLRRCATGIDHLRRKVTQQTLKDEIQQPTKKGQ